MKDEDTKNVNIYSGLTRREAFAMHAMGSMMIGALSSGQSVTYVDCAMASVLQAEELIKALEGGKE